MTRYTLDLSRGAFPKKLVVMVEMVTGPQAEFQIYPFTGLPPLKIYQDETACSMFGLGHCLRTNFYRVTTRVNRTV